LKTLTVKLKEAEARAEFAEKTVKKLQKEVDRLEGETSFRLNLHAYFSRAIRENRDRDTIASCCVSDELGINKDRYKSLADEMDSTFAELAGY